MTVKNFHQKVEKSLLMTSTTLLFLVSFQTIALVQTHKSMRVNKDPSTCARYMVTQAHVHTRTHTHSHTHTHAHIHTHARTRTRTHTRTRKRTRTHTNERNKQDQIIKNLKSETSSFERPFISNF